MLDAIYRQGYDFETFMNSDEGAHSDKVREFLQLSQDAVTDELRERIMSVSSARFVVFAEVWCPDCMINVSVLEAIRQINPKIEYTVVPRTGLEDVLAGITPDNSIKIPTFAAVDEAWNVTGVFLEKPQIVRDVENGEDQVKRIVVKKDYRKGKYILDAMEEIVGLL